MSRDREQRLREFSDRRNQKILDILRCENDRGILFSYALHSVSDIFNCRHIGEEEVQLIDARCCVSFTEKLIRHIREDVEQHRILEAFVAVHESFHTEAEEVTVGDIRMTVEVFAFASHTHRVDAEADLLESFLGVQVLACLIVGHIFFLAQLVEVLHRREVRAFLLAVVGGIGDAESRIELCEEYLDGVDLRIVEFLIAPEKVLEECDVL